MCVIVRIQKVRNSKRQKNQEKRQKVVDGRKHLAELRVVQRNLVFVIGLSPRLADPEVQKVGCVEGLGVSLCCLDVKEARVFWQVWTNSQDRCQQCECLPRTTGTV